MSGDQNKREEAVDKCLTRIWMPHGCMVTWSSLRVKHLLYIALTILLP